MIFHYLRHFDIYSTLPFKIMTQSRAKREQLRYDTGLDRSRYNRIFSHCSAFATPLRLANAVSFLKPKVDNGVVLELGSSSWRHWFDKADLNPKELHCINISQGELEIGIDMAKHSRLSPTFHLMDAHKLEFEDDTFDAVYGAGILHHLDLETAVSEIRRVLKPDGIATFFEPLDINPVGKLVRYFTPGARTEDEKPFTFHELDLIENHFDLEIDAFQFTSVPIGVLSRFIFSNPRNAFTRCAHQIDEALKVSFKPMRWLYRNINIYAQSKK